MHQRQRVNVQFIVLAGCRFAYVGYDVNYRAVCAAREYFPDFLVYKFFAFKGNAVNCHAAFFCAERFEFYAGIVAFGWYIRKIEEIVLFAGFFRYGEHLGMVFEHTVLVGNVADPHAVGTATVVNDGAYGIALLCRRTENIVDAPRKNIRVNGSRFLERIDKSIVGVRKFPVGGFESSYALRHGKVKIYRSSRHYAVNKEFAPTAPYIGRGRTERNFHVVYFVKKLAACAVKSHGSPECRNYMCHAVKAFFSVFKVSFT